MPLLCEGKKFNFMFVQLLSVMVQACCLALLDACVPMMSVFAGVTCAYTDEDKCVLDPTSEQEQVGCNKTFFF
jgi:ribonuclease PH